MELPFKPSAVQQTIHKIQDLSKQFIELFSSTDYTINHSDEILTNFQLEQRLHQSYVSAQSVRITFEYYEQEQIYSHQLTAKIMSPVQLNQTIAIQPEACTYLIHLPLEQILTVEF